MFSTTDTIVAIATPPGRGGLGVVRISGPEAPEIAMRLLGLAKPLIPRRATFGRVVASAEAEPRTVDEVVVTWFTAPQSYTREEVVEIGAHGSPVVLREIVSLAIDAGARLAEPGEFTLRAYLNGRLDLIQAEAVADVIDAVTPAQARAAMDQLEGTLTTRLANLGEGVFNLIAALEASIDFPEEGFHFIQREEVVVQLAAIEERVAAVLAEAGRGRLLREGATLALAGRPNVGKSSLFNALLGTARAIVTDVPGTTRDMISDRVDIDGIPITLVDTAGLHEARDVVEAEGIRRAHRAIAVAAVTIEVRDATAVKARAEQGAVEVGGRRLIVWNKVDLVADDVRRSLARVDDAILVSALTGEGLPQLRTRIVSTLMAGEVLRDTPAISNVRQIRLLERVATAVSRARAVASQGATEEIVLAELAAARVAFEAVTGRTTDEDMLRHIFSRFCIGK